MPPESSGRNRPSAVGGVLLSWDANGNLISKGNLRFAYDIHNRLTRVTNALGTEIAHYDYDALGRRVRKTFPDSTTLETTYSGWRELEEYRNGQIAGRNTFGLGLDEIVRLELDQDGDGLLEQALVPVYDSAGNLAMLLTPEGRIAGKYSYSPFGDQLKAKVDNVPPSIEQLRLERQPDGVLRLEINLGEAIDGRRINTGFSLAPLPEPQAGTKGTATKQSLALETHQPIQDGRRARRRVIVTATDPPDAGGELDLQVGVEGIADLFQNQLAEPFTMRLTVPAAGAAPVVLLDTANPEIDEVRLSDGHLEVSFTEQPDVTAAAAALRIDGATVSWSLLPESYTLRSEQPLAAGAHGIRIEQGAPLDLAGKGVGQTFEQSFTFDGVQAIAAIFEAPDPREVPLETLANRLTFQGRPYDAETGLFYFRNRYYDPELGRFITPDPLGYVDGPSVYAFAGYSPFNYGDPYGLCIGNLPCPEWVQRTGRSLGGFFYQVPVTAKEIAILPAAALQADYRARKQRLDAYLAGGYSALEEERSVQAAHTKEGAKRAIPIYGTILQAGEIVAAYEQGGAFEGGRQVFRATFSLGGDVTLAYGAVRGVQAARDAAVGPEVTYASMLEEMQGEVAAARAAERMRRVTRERLADRAQWLPREKRPNTVAVLRSRNGRLVIGRNQGGVTNPDVEAALDRIPPNEFRGLCAEANCIARALNKGIDVRGATIDVVNVRGPGSMTGIHATPKPPCTVCQELLDFFEIRW
ncbi:MAG: hypothetical protein HC897_07795 [Thermoanaerobaculia bacterium]|nr:hypothetical protein [Thermoanaerobaculia bacterium]